MRSNYIYILFFIISSSIFAKDPNDYLKRITDNETFKKIKEVVVEVKEVTDKYPIQYIDADTEVQNDVCVSCDDILVLTKNVNKIVQELGKDDPTSHLILEHGNLEALTVVTEAVNKATGNVNCSYEPNSRLSDEFTDIKTEDLELQFEKVTNLDYAYAQYRFSNNKRIIWLRGKGRDQRKVIKVTIYPDGHSELSYYLLPVDSYNEKLQVKKLGVADNLPNLDVDDHREAGLKELIHGKVDLSTGFTIDTSPDTFIKVKVGPSFNYEYFIPKDIKLLNVTSKAQLTEDYNLSGDIEVTAKGQKASVNLQNEKGRKLLSAEIDKDDIKLGAGGELNINDEFSIDSLATYSIDGSYSINASLSHLQNNLVDTSFTRTSNGDEIVSISKKLVDKDKGTFSIKLDQTLNKGNQAQSGVWLTYSKRF
ncbi:hypothetical protein [Bacteriovorax sp. Seq25_V]|uniref:hypothetical protein n=1 Tax=Bacteriovorax sp. Seq25_V TaxID=1201288 RepID=UPI000389DC20|nr:hypothetical protein [Bacteriovorax sp. Seq25_V]EQC45462.1 hypothetical protein M900_2012 [Bacteriovorax sp. Seq25_V]